MARAASLAFVPLPSTGRPCGVVARAPGSGAKPEGSRPTHQASVSPSHFAGCCEDCRRWAQCRSRRLAGERVGRSGALIHRWAPGATCCWIQGVAPGWVRVRLGGAHRLPPRPTRQNQGPSPWRWPLCPQACRRSLSPKVRLFYGSEACMSLFFLGGDSRDTQKASGVLRTGPSRGPWAIGPQGPPQEGLPSWSGIISTLQPKAEPGPHGTKGQGCHPAPGLGWVGKALSRAHGRASVPVSTVGAEPRPTHR